MIRIIMNATRFPSAVRRLRTLCLLAAASALLAACGGGKGGDSSSDTVLPASAKPGNASEAGRFLTQATYGPTSADVSHVQSVGFSTWLDEQFATASTVSYKTYWDTRDAAKKAVSATASAGTTEVNHAFWTNAVAGPDQLRQRVAFALSQIFVVSMQDSCGADHPQGVAHYMDTLVSHAFGSYRSLLEAVTLHPVMGCYLSHLKNQKEDAATGRVPDENYAREVMQLFSIGLYQLNTDGSVKTDSAGKPIETYKPEDIAGLAKVFTGWSWDCPNWPSNNCFKYGSDSSATYTDKWARPMRPYAQYHSISAKTFLGTTIAAQTTADPAASLKTALDALANHANVGPFIGKQLIQRLVTSNPSPAYVKRVAQAFKSSGGNLQATVRAILMDVEARNMANVNNNSFGKVREPMLRLSALLRAYGAQSATGSFLLWNTADPATSLGQNILWSPSVFNFYRPGYTPPGSSTAAAGLVAPEMQLVHETSAPGYVNFMRGVVSWGLGAGGYDNTGSTPDVRLEYIANTNSATLALAADPTALVDDINQRLFYGTMSAELKTLIVNAVSTLTSYYPLGRVRAALLLAVSSPEFQVQR